MSEIVGESNPGSGDVLHNGTTSWEKTLVSPTGITVIRNGRVVQANIQPHTEIRHPDGLVTKLSTSCVFDLEAMNLALKMRRESQKPTVASGSSLTETEL